MTGRPRRCHYATDPATRPDCAITAAIGYGPTALCRPCDTRRSTLGKGHPSRPLAPAGPIDPLQLIGDAHTELRRAERELAGAVHRARQHRQPWTAIGEQLGITRQAAQQRFTRAPPTAAANADRRWPTTL